MGKYWQYAGVCVLCPVILALLSFYALDMYMMCGYDIIADVCEQHKQQEITGSLCRDLCETKTIVKTRCLTTNPEKIVYQATWRNKEIILKYDTYSAILNAYTNEHLNDENDCKNEITAAVNMLLGESENSTILVQKLLSIADVDNDGQLSITETKVMLQLLRTTEPSMLLMLNGSQVAVNLYGFCGRLYAVEKLPVIADRVYGLEVTWEDFSIFPNIFEPIENIFKQTMGSIVSYFTSFDIITNNTETLILELKTLVTKNFYMSRIPSIEERFSFVIDMLDIIFEISNSSNTLVMACDTHLGNFGISDKNELKYLDYDLIYPLHYLAQLLSSKKCSHHDDCSIGDFDDCTSMCNHTTGTCSTAINFDMLQIICFKAFPLIFRNIYMDFKDRNQTELKCLENMVKEIALYCLKIHPAKDLTQLHSHVETVKENFLNVTMRKSYCSL